MGNIKHNDELLRVHDDGFDVVFNCDNKHQNGVSYHAEKNGKKTKIDPEYAAASLVKNVGLVTEFLGNALETGGMGHTEEHPPLNVFSAEMDGNYSLVVTTANEGEITTIIDGTFYYAYPHPAELTNKYFLVEGQSYDVTLNGTEYNNLIAFNYLDGICIGSIRYDVYPFCITSLAPETIYYKIDEKYLPEISPTDEVLENAKETGGIGWTESGVQTIIVDSESVTTVVDDSGLAVGQFVTPFDIVNGAYTVIFNGTEYNLNSTFNERAGIWFLGDILEGGPDFSRYPFIIYAQSEKTMLFTESSGDYDVTIKVEPETVHKIDEKYLPASGSAEKFVVTFTVDDNNIATPDKTDSEINEALFKGLRIVGLIPSLLAFEELQYTDGIGSGGIYTNTHVYTPNNTYSVYQIICDVDENYNRSYSYVEKTYSLTERD